MRTKPRVWLGIAVRVGVVVCVAVAAAGAVKLDDTLGVFDVKADENAVSTYRDRTYPAWLAGSEDAMEDARLWMPEDASYRVVLGTEASKGDARFAKNFLFSLLLPRRLTAESARWVFCYGCDTAKLGGRFEVLTTGGGFSFGRVEQP